MKTKQKTLKLINVVLNQSTKEEIETFINQLDEMILIPIQNALNLNKEELKEVKKTALKIMNNKQLI
tara:strand:+ start:375 stop:575 length:201 start_codon:yes stop_codon:yes gene_type:complete